MKILLLLGNQSNQQALAVKVAKHFDIAGIVLETRKSKQGFKLSSLFFKVINRLVFAEISRSWINMLQFYKKNTNEINNFPVLHTHNVNSKEVQSLIKDLLPDLIMVSGTSLLKAEILTIQPPKGIINLHTGLSPYVKGGPNCTNWCIANNTMHLVGNTIMWIDKGIDSGNIITTETTPLSGNETLYDLHIKVMEHAHDLYIRALFTIKNNFEKCPSIKQSDISEGQLFLSKMWTFKKKLHFLLNVKTKKYQKSIMSNEFKKKLSELKLVSLPYS